MIDMVTADKGFRDIEDSIEHMRAPFHVKNLSWQEMAGLFRSHGILSLTVSEEEIEQELSAWLELTRTPEEPYQTLLSTKEEDIAGGRKPDFNPYDVSVKTPFFIVGQKTGHYMQQNSQIATLDE